MGRLHDATLRASAEYAYVPARLLSELGWREGASAGVKYSGALCPRRDAWRGTRAVDAETAGVFTALKRPGRLPRRLLSSLGDDADLAIAQLVLDGVLEIELADGFVSGPDAHGVVFTGPRPSGVTPSHIARMSAAAIEHAAAMDTDDVVLLADRLYCYNRCPASPAWLRRLPTREATARYLGVHASGPCRKTLDRHWTDGGISDAADGWTYWNATTRGLVVAPGGHAFKLFVSPAPAQAPSTLQTTIEMLAAADAPAFKHAGGVYSLLRPDKIVVYFDEFEQLKLLAQALEPAIRGTRAHVVPFSGQLDEAGLLSWGIDPPRTHQPLAWQDSESWRTLIVSRLARSLVLARHARRLSITAAEFALDRIGLDGVDVQSWAPLVP